ncbi:MAG: alpha/beta fold hydrolase [Archangium sp.]
MKLELEEFGGDGPVVHFAHANGFPPGTYSKLLRELTKRFRVVAMKSRQLRRDVSPSTLINWEVLADDLVDSLRAANLTSVIGVGHSMGGVATLIAASRAPELFSKVIALDPVIFSARDELLFRALKKTRLVKHVGPARSAHRRREVWPSRAAAAAGYRTKPLFRNFDAESFGDYLKFGLTDFDDGVRLAIPREWEAKVFETGPDDVWSALKSLTVPSVFIRGSSSDVFSPSASARVTKTVPNSRRLETPGGHLFPLEHPLTCAQLLD